MNSMRLRSLRVGSWFSGRKSGLWVHYGDLQNMLTAVAEDPEYGQARADVTIAELKDNLAHWSVNA